MAYDRPEQLKILLDLLDDERNDIFVHIDADANFPMETIGEGLQYAGLYITNRISVRWADFSQIMAELTLLRCAAEKGNYWYYHLLSGQDLPIKSQDEIHDFFSDKRDEFVATVPYEGKYQIEHVKVYYPLLRCKSYRTNIFLKIMNSCMIRLQKLVAVNRIKQYTNIHFYDGWTWFSITDGFARFALQHEAEIAEIFKSTKASDEMVFQTLAMNSQYKDRLHSVSDLQEGSMRMIDWKRGKPYVFQKEDFNSLIDSPYMFARKFDMINESERELVGNIYFYIKGEQQTIA